MGETQSEAHDRLIRAILNIDVVFCYRIRVCRVLLHTYCTFLLLEAHCERWRRGGGSAVMALDIFNSIFVEDRIIYESVDAHWIYRKIDPLVARRLNYFGSRRY